MSLAAARAVCFGRRWCTWWAMACLARCAVAQEAQRGDRRRRGPGKKQHREAMIRMRWEKSIVREHERLSRLEETADEAFENAARSERASKYVLPKAPPWKDRVEFSRAEFRGAASRLYYDRKHKLVLCAVPKVACTELIKLVYRLSGDSSWQQNPHFRGDSPTLASLGIAQANEVMNDPTWTKAVFVRDPLHRLVSAYLDKFVLSPRRGLHANYGVRMFGRALSFDEFARRVASNATTRDRGPEGLHLGTNAHWKPQRFTCSLEKFAHLFAFVGRYENIREHAEGLLRSLGLWEHYGQTGWAPRGAGAALVGGKANNSSPRRDSIFARAAAHRTGSRAKYADLFASSPGLEALLREAYAMDYEFIDALFHDGGDDDGDGVNNNNNNNNSRGHPPGGGPPASGFAWAPKRGLKENRRLCALDPGGFGDYCS